MKKLVIYSYILLLLVLIVLSVFNFNPEILEKIEGDKQVIVIQKPETITNEEFIKSIKNVIDQCDADIMYKYVKVSESKTENYYYSVENNEGFIDSDLKKLFKSNHFQKWSQIKNYDLSAGRYYIKPDKMDSVINGIKELGYEVQIDTTTLVAGKTSVILFGGIPAILMLMSIIFYNLSQGKKNMLKKMEGYSLIDLIASEIKSQILKYIFIFILLEIVTFIVAKSYFNQAVMPYMLYELQYILGGFCVILFGGVVAVIIVGFQNKAEYIKGKVPKRGIYYITMACCVAFMVFLVFFMTIGIRNVKIYYDTYKTAKNLSEKIEGYVTFPQYEVNISSEGMDDNYKDFYEQTVSEYQGILVDANNYEYDLLLGNTLAEEYGQDYIIVNENYLKFNPIYGENGKQITVLMKADKINVLLPNTKQDEKEKYILLVKQGYNKDVNFVNYDTEKTNVYSYNASIGNEAGGKLKEPVIIVINEENLTGMFISSYCSTGSYFIKGNTDNPYEEFKPTLTNTGIIQVTPETPYISSEFSDLLSQQAGMFMLYGTQTLILCIGLLCLIIFSGILYCENYKDKIVSKLIEGHTIYKCINKHIIIKLMIYILSGLCTGILGRLMIVSMNYYIIAVAFVFDIIFTISLCKRIAKRKVYDLVKGAE